MKVEALVGAADRVVGAALPLILAGLVANLLLPWQ